MGAKKKTKKQIEEEKALAEEQKRIEEELRKKQEEEEAERRRIEEEKRRIEEEKRRQEELVRLNEQAPMVAERDAQMIDKRNLAKKGRKKDLDDKYLACDPLPDPEDEKDLTTFLTLWREEKDADLKNAVNNCQTAENVVKSINLMLSEAMAQYDYNKIQWCQDYIKEIREIIMQKYDEISAQVLTYIEHYTKYTDEELKELMEQNPNRALDKKDKPDFNLTNKSQDILFGLWANVAAKSLVFDKVNFDCYRTCLPR